MAEFDSSKIGYALTIDGKYYNALDIEAFSLMMKDPSYCYKFYWLETIVQLISEDISEVRDVFTEQRSCQSNMTWIILFRGHS